MLLKKTAFTDGNWNFKVDAQHLFGFGKYAKLLFLLFWNYLRAVLISAHKLLFTEDWRIYYIFSPDLNFVSLQNDNNGVSNYCRTYNLLLNKECRVMFYTRKPIYLKSEYNDNDTPLVGVDSIGLDITLKFHLYFDILNYLLIVFLVKLSVMSSFKRD